MELNKLIQDEEEGLDEYLKTKEIKNYEDLRLFQEERYGWVPKEIAKLGWGEERIAEEMEKKGLCFGEVCLCY